MRFILVWTQVIIGILQKWLLSWGFVTTVTKPYLDQVWICPLHNWSTFKPRNINKWNGIPMATFEVEKWTSNCSKFATLQLVIFWEIQPLWHYSFVLTTCCHNPWIIWNFSERIPYGKSKVLVFMFKCATIFSYFLTERKVWWILVNIELNECSCGNLICIRQNIYSRNICLHCGPEFVVQTRVESLLHWLGKTLNASSNS